MLVNDSALTDTIRSVSTLDTNKKYYWRVTAKQNLTSLYNSTIWKFTNGAVNLAVAEYVLV